MTGSSPVTRHTRVPFAALWPFLLIAFGIAWGLMALYIFIPEPITVMFGEITASHPLFILAVYSPAIAAFIVVLYCGGMRGLSAYLSRLLLWRCPPAWYLYLLIGVPLIYTFGSLIKGNLFSDPLPFTSFGALLSAMGFMMVLGPIEEFGWRGVALPLLQRRLAPIWAALVLGLIWGIWHFPAFLLSGTPQSAWSFTPFLIGSVCLSVLVTPMFNASHGSILLAALHHFQINNPLWPDAQPYDTIVFVAAALLVVALNRKTLFVKAGAITTVIPERVV